MPDLGGDVQVFPGEPGSRDGSAYGRFVAIHFGRVEVAIAESIDTEAAAWWVD